MKKKMSKVSDNVSEQLEIAAQEALEKMDPFQQLMNAGVEYEKEQQEEQPDKPKRKRRTKAEMQAAREEESQEKEDDSVLKCNTSSHIMATVVWDQDKDDTVELPKYVEIPDNILVGDYDMDTIADWLSNTVGYCHKNFTLSWPRHENHDQLCEWEIEKAHIEGKAEPDLDFRKLYRQGDRVYLVRHYSRSNTKELIFMKLRTIYARSMVGVVKKQYCQCVGLTDKDNIFYNRQEALKLFNSIKATVADEYDEETGKKKRKRKKAIEEDEDISDSETYDDESEDEDDE